MLNYCIDSSSESSYIASENAERWQLGRDIGLFIAYRPVLHPGKTPFLDVRGSLPNG
jgi:hypothetical protein